jgi:ATP-binding protein involved in chromosome partitioning
VSVTKEQVLSALAAVQDPDLHKDIVSLGFVKDVTITGGEVDFTIELTTPACPVKDLMKVEAEGRVAALPGVSVARARMTANVSTRGGAGRQQIPGVRNIIAVGAGKGGVGKTTTAVNLAVALARKGARVGLLDGDVYGPNVPQMLGLQAPPEVDQDKRIVPPRAHGIAVISMGMLVPKDQPLIWRGPMLHGVLQQFMRDVVWGERDYLIVDLPPGTGDVVLSMAQSVPAAGAVVVTTPQDVAVADVRKAVGMFRQLNVPVLGVVENMSCFVCSHCQQRTAIFGSGGGRALAEELAVPFLGEIPIDTRVREGSDQGRPIVVESPEAPAAVALLDVAGRVAAQVSIENARVLRLVQSG